MYTSSHTRHAYITCIWMDILKYMHKYAHAEYHTLKDIHICGVLILGRIFQLVLPESVSNSTSAFFFSCWHGRSFFFHVGMNAALYK